jgi:uncharacterized protein (DUF58 family)
VTLFFRLVYIAYRLQAGLRYRLGRRFTRAGLAVAGGCVAAGLGGLDTDNTVGYQAFALLLFLVLISSLFVFFFRSRFAARRSLPRFGTAGQPLHYRVKVANRTARRQAGLTLLETLADSRPTFAEWLAVQRADEKRLRSFRFGQQPGRNPFRSARTKEAAVPAIPPNQEVEFGAELTPLRRGTLRFGEMTLARPDPLGLVRAFARVPSPQSVLILPRRYPLPPIALPGTTKYQQGGVVFASHVGQSEEFVALRDYRRGDPLRHMHWRSWAKFGRPIVKEFEDEFFVRHALVLDTFTDDPRSELFEEAVSVAASFACTVITQESLLDLLFIGPKAYCFTAGRGLAHADQMLEILASVRACGDESFARLERLVLEHAPRVSGCICVLLGWDAARQDLVRKLKRLGLPLLVLALVESGQGRALDAGPLSDEPGRLHPLELGRIEQDLAKLR